MHPPDEKERGQTVVEFAILCTALLILTAGVVDAGRAFFAYNSVSAAARYGARWASVIGGSCALPYARSSSDFCNQFGTGAGTFWSQSGNAPIQGSNATCPSYATTPADYYTASSFSATTASTVVGAIAKHFDTSSGSTGFIQGGLIPGLDLAQLKVCIEINADPTTAGAGSTVRVVVYYPFSLASSLLSSATILLNASSQAQVE